jgi:hypothetical protein
MNQSDLTLTPSYLDPSTHITPDIAIDVNTSYSMLLAWGPSDGIVYHSRKEISTIFIAPEGVAPRTSTKLAFVLTGQTAGTKDNYFTANATLTDVDDTPIPNTEVGVYLKGLIADGQLATAVTNANGVATFNFTYLMEYSSDSVLLAKFSGNMDYKKSSSETKIISYTGSVQKEEAPFLIIPMDMDFIVPWLTGLGSIAAVGFMWSAFGYVIYSVLIKNAIQPDAKSSKEVQEGK